MFHYTRKEISNSELDRYFLKNMLIFLMFFKMLGIKNYLALNTDFARLLVLNSEKQSKTV
jgi:hypothetical protein